MKVEIYSDIACPWCYVGKRRFERALAAFPGAEDIQVTYRPYELDPTTPAEPARCASGWPRSSARRTSTE